MPLAKFRCMCGSVHALPRERVLEGLGVSHWKCTDCGRLFVLTHQPPDGFVPIYLDPGVRAVKPRPTGSAAARNLKNPMPPPAIDFRCRCGHRITAHSWMYGGTSVCSACGSAMYLALRYHVREKRHVIVPEYPPRATGAGRG
jgi:hypothetical protein